MFYFYKDGTFFINIKATTKASKDEIRGIRNDELLISVTAVPENNKANVAIINLLSKKLKIPKTDIDIISGEKGRNKKISIHLEKEKNIDSILSNLNLPISKN
ncbi:MAG: DUF167 domain-containing protein [Alphaproteobacteria bacterium]|nr:DUF167 domain-containing protein [Alphaproteobacteria bacterium]